MQVCRDMWRASIRRRSVRSAMSVAMHIRFGSAAPYGVEPTMAVQLIEGFDPLRGRAPYNTRSSTDRTLLRSAPPRRGAPRRGAPRRIAGRWCPMIPLHRRIHRAFLTDSQGAASPRHTSADNVIVTLLNVRQV